MDNGYVVRRFDLHNISKSDGWNCMDSLLADPERIGENAEIFANVIISNAGRSAGIYDRTTRLRRKISTLSIRCSRTQGERNIWI